MRRIRKIKGLKIYLYSFEKL